MKQQIDILSINIHALRDYIESLINTGYIIDTVAASDDYTWLIIYHEPKTIP